MAFDASPSWSGFNYQGKVALYYALKQINEKPVGSDFSNYSLMLEDTEDFEIRLNGESVSFHQVKAYNSSSYSDYSDALFGITLELYKKPDVIGKIHTWKLINSKPNTLSLIESVKDDLRKILDQYDNGNPNNGSSVLEKAASTDSNIPKKAAILRAAFSGSTPGQFYALLESVLEERNDVLARLASYRYDDGNCFCDLYEINKKIRSEIGTYLSNRNLTATSGKTRKSFYYFLGVMDKYIIDRHKAKKNNEKIQLKFDEIISHIDIDHEDIGTEYLACKFKEKFASLIDEYIGDPEDYRESEGDSICNLKEARKFLLSLSPQELWGYYRSFSPQIDLHHECNTENALEASTEGIRHILIKILHDMNIERVVHDGSPYNFIYRTKTSPHQSYLPTTITSVARKEHTARKIVNNPSMSEALYEVENLIYGGSESYVFSPNSMAHTEAPQAQGEDGRSKRDEVLRNITLVPIAFAKDTLNS